MRHTRSSSTIGQVLRSHRAWLHARHACLPWSSAFALSPWHADVLCGARRPISSERRTDASTAADAAATAAAVGQGRLSSLSALPAALVFLFDRRSGRTSGDDAHGTSSTSDVRSSATWRRRSSSASSSVTFSSHTLTTHLDDPPHLLSHAFSSFFHPFDLSVSSNRVFERHECE